MPADLVTTCFKHPSPFGCSHSPPFGLTKTQVLELAARGHTKCIHCAEDGDARRQVRDFPTFGIPEALFGLDVWHGRKTIPASGEHRVVLWDIGVDVPHEGTILYASTAQGARVGPDAESIGPRLLAPHGSHIPWSLQQYIYAPPSKREVLMGFMFVMTPETPLEPALDYAVQAVGQFHRGQFNVACVLLAASVEASLRARLKLEYARRGVQFEKTAGFATLIQRARLLLDPQLGPKILDDLKRLANEARNPAAHGEPVMVTPEDITGWMVSAAVIYEWSKLAESVHAPTPNPAPRKRES